MLSWDRNQTVSRLRTRRLAPATLKVASPQVSSAGVRSPRWVQSVPELPGDFTRCSLRPSTRWSSWRPYPATRRMPISVCGWFSIPMIRRSPLRSCPRAPTILLRAEAIGTIATTRGHERRRVKPKVALLRRPLRAYLQCDVPIVLQQERHAEELWRLDHQVGECVPIGGL